LSGNDLTPKPRRQALSYPFATHAAGSAAISVAKTLIKAGFEAYLAGGAVRDILLKRTPKDFDIATNAKPEQVLELFQKTRKVGIAFGVVLVNDFGPTIEIATFRTDGVYSDGRHPDQVVFSTASEDAQRRDFTANGLFFDLNCMEIVDYVGGLDDLKARLLRAIGSAPKRFNEDYLRMLRAIRFAISLNFEIEASTWIALQEHAPQIQAIAKDRIHEELRRTFIHGRSDKALRLLHDSKLMAHCLPQTNTTWQFTSADNDCGGNLSVILALMLQGLKSPSKLEPQLEAMRCSNPEKKCVITYIKSLSPLHDYANLSLAQRKRCLRQFDADELRFFIDHQSDLQTIKSAIFEDLARWSTKDYHPEIMLRGQDLIESGWEKGPLIGKTLELLETEILNEAINTREQISQWLKSHLESIN